MYSHSLMEQNCYIVSKRSTPLDNVPLHVALRNSFTAQLSTCSVKVRSDRVNGTSVLLVLSTKVLTSEQVAAHFQNGSIPRPELEL
jgi:hypothetical protein